MCKVLNENKLKENYHVDAKGNSIPFCTLLNCFDQICYFEFRKISNFSHWIYFCDDINLAINDFGYPAIRDTSVHRKYQNMETWIIERNYFEEITNLLKQKDTIMLSTAFNYVRNYAWWNESKEHLHTDHLMYLVEEDRDSYYIVDSPTVFLNIEKIRLEFNPSIVKIPKENFREAFQKSCVVYKICFHDLPTENEELSYLREVLTEITDEYFINLCNSLRGRNALVYLQEKCALSEEEIFRQCFLFHIIVSRRFLLKRSIHIVSGKRRYNNEIIRCLNLSIDYWSKIRDLAYKFVHANPDDGISICKEATSVLIPLIKNEDVLMEGLRKIIIETN